MLNNRKVALYIDMDNCGFSFTHYQNALKQADSIGQLLFAKVYGVSERKHKAVLADICAKGFNMAPTMRVKKRGQKLLDNRIIVDVMEDVLQNSNIDTVMILCASGDLVHLYRKLHSYDIAIAALDNNDEEDTAFVDLLVDVGYVEKIKTVKRVKKSAPVAKPVQESPKTEEINTKNDFVKTEPQDLQVKESLEQIPEVVEQPTSVVEQPISQPEVVVASVEEKPIIVDNFDETEQNFSNEKTEDNAEDKLFDFQKDYKPMEHEAVIDDIEKSKEATEVTDENEQLLDEIRKLLDEFKSEP